MLWQGCGARLGDSSSLWTGNTTLLMRLYESAGMGAAMGAELARFSFDGDMAPAPAMLLAGDRAPAWHAPHLSPPPPCVP